MVLGVASSLGKNLYPDDLVNFLGEVKEGLEGNFDGAEDTLATRLVSFFLASRPYTACEACITVDL